MKQHGGLDTLERGYISEPVFHSNHKGRLDIGREMVGITILTNLLWELAAKCGSERMVGAFHQMGKSFRMVTKSAVRGYMFSPGSTILLRRELVVDKLE